MTPPDPWAFGWTQLLTIIGFVITLGIALGGFRTFGRWKREKLEEKRIEIALDMLGMVYEAKYIFDNIRSPMSFDYEWRDMPEGVGNNEGDRRRRGPFFATLKRIEAHREFFERAWKLQPRCIAVFGPEAEEIFLLMHRSRREIEVSAEMLVFHNLGNDRDTIRQFERDVWDTAGHHIELDRVGARLNEFRTRAEALCRPVIHREFGRRGVRIWKRSKGTPDGSNRSGLAKG